MLTVRENMKKIILAVSILFLTIFSASAKEFILPDMSQDLAQVFEDLSKQSSSCWQRHDLTIDYYTFNFKDTYYYEQGLKQIIYTKQYKDDLYGLFFLMFEDEYNPTLIVKLFSGLMEDKDLEYIEIKNKRYYKEVGKDVFYNFSETSGKYFLLIAKGLQVYNE